MINTHKNLQASVPSAEVEHQCLVVTVPNDYKEIVSPQSSFSDLLQHSTPCTEVKNSLHGCKVSLNDELKF